MLTIVTSFVPAATSGSLNARSATASFGRSSRSFIFGPFVLQPECQRLLKNDAPVRLGGRALEILTALVERPGEIVSKQQLLARVWPNTFVEQDNLKTNVAQLRRALGERHAQPCFIATVVGRGYRFVSPVRTYSAAILTESACNP